MRPKLVQPESNDMRETGSSKKIFFTHEILYSPLEARTLFEGFTYSGKGNHIWTLTSATELHCYDSCS